ncbi:MAG: hypothetical protein WDO16_18175 [Bacteroidota bacterium]
MYFSSMRWFNHTLYIANYDGIYQLTGDTAFQKLFSKSLVEKNWRGFFMDSKKRFWINEIERAHVLISAPANKLELTDSIALNIPLVSGCFEDKDHNIWIASGEGLLKIQEQNTSEYTIETNPLINDIRNVAESPGKTMYAFSRENGILQFNKTGFAKTPFQFYQTNKEAKNDFPDSYAADDKGRLWLGTRESRLFCLDNGKLIDYSRFIPRKGNYLAWISYNPVARKLFTSQDTLKTVTDEGIEIFTRSIRNN